MIYLATLKVSENSGGRQDGRQKQKPSGKLFIHIKQQISVRQATKISNEMFHAGLFEFNLILFRVLQIKSIPRHLYG